MLAELAAQKVSTPISFKSLSALSSSLKPSAIPLNENYYLKLTVDTILSKKYYADYLAADRLQLLIEKNLITQSIAENSSDSLLKRITEKFYLCFPHDAAEYLMSLQTLSSLLTPSAQLRNRFQNFINDLGFDGKVDKFLRRHQRGFNPIGISTLAAYEHFMHLKPLPEKEVKSLVDKGSKLLKDLIIYANRTSCDEKTNLLTQAVSTFRLLGYLLKNQERTHFHCSDEYDVFCKIGIRNNLILKDCCPDEPLAQMSEGPLRDAQSCLGIKLSRNSNRKSCTIWNNMREKGFPILVF